MDETKTNDRAGAARGRATSSRGSRPSWPAGPPRRSSARSASFYASVAEVFERWVARRESKHTRRAYRQDVMAFVRVPRDPLARRRDAALHRLGRRRPGLPRPDARRRQGPQDDQPPHRLALELLQVPPGGRLRVPPPDHRPEPGARPVHPPRLVRPARRDQGPLRHPGPAAHGAARRAIRSSTTGTGRSSSSSSTAGPGSAPAAGSRSRTSTRTATRRPSPSTRRATSTAGSGSTSPRPRRSPSTSRRRG